MQTEIKVVISINYLIFSVFVRCKADLFDKVKRGAMMKDSAFT